MAWIAQEHPVALITESAPTSLSAAHKLSLAAAFASGAVIWFLLLSGWLGVTPGSVITQRQNVLFSSDSSIWISAMTGETKSIFLYPHPLQNFLWRPPARALFHLLSVFLPANYAALLAARLLSAVVAGIGIGFLGYLALQNDIPITQCVLLFSMYLLFTCNATMSLPEHFAISNGLLTIAFVVPVLTASPRIRTRVLSALVVLCGGTTITNALFPLASLAHFSIKSLRVRIALALAAIPAALGVTLLLYKKSFSLHYFIGSFLNWRLIHDPLKAGVYTFFAFVGPVIGPIPRVLRFPGWDMVSYEPGHLPLQLTYHPWVLVLGVAAWLALFLTCVLQGLREERTRPYAWLLLGWILFNATFHNIWGDEFILYSPHWSWALMGLVVLGARRLSRAFVAAMIVPITISQIWTLLAIKSALQTITR